MHALRLLVPKKYERGARQHDEDLTQKTTLELLTEIRDEAIDQFVYAQTPIQKELKRWTAENLDIKVPPHKKVKG